MWNQAPGEGVPALRGWAHPSKAGSKCRHTGLPAVPPAKLVECAAGRVRTHLLWPGCTRTTGPQCRRQSPPHLREARRVQSRLGARPACWCQYSPGSPTRRRPAGSSRPADASDVSGGYLTSSAFWFHGLCAANPGTCRTSNWPEGQRQNGQPGEWTALQMRWPLLPGRPPRMLLGTPTPRSLASLLHAWRQLTANCLLLGW